MGHKSIQTTLRYAHVDDRMLADAALSALAYHADKGAASGGFAGDDAGDLPRSGTEGSVPKPQTSAAFRQPECHPTVLQIRLRRFDSGSGLQNLMH
jgi:hypothetical protein